MIRMVSNPWDKSVFDAYIIINDLGIPTDMALTHERACALVAGKPDWFFCLATVIPGPNIAVTDEALGRPVTIQSEHEKRQRRAAAKVKKEINP